MAQLFESQPMLNLDSEPQPSDVRAKSHRHCGTKVGGGGVMVRYFEKISPSVESL